MAKIQQDKPELVTNTFLEHMNFMRPTPSSRELMHFWLQVRRPIMSSFIIITGYRGRKVTDIELLKSAGRTSRRSPKTVVETGAVPICPKVEKPIHIPRPVPDKTFIISAMGRLDPANGILRN